MKLISTALLIFAILSIQVSAYGPVSHNCRRLWKKCMFKFAGEHGPSVYDPTKVPFDTPFTPLIVAKNPKVRLGVLNTNGITPRFVFPKSTDPITHFGKPRFTPTHIKPFPKKGTFGSALGIQTLTGNQGVVGSNKCIIVWFTQFQLLTKGHEPVVIENKVAKKYDFKCVVFLTPKMKKPPRSAW